MATDTFHVREAVIADAPEVMRLLAQLGHAMVTGDSSATLSGFLDQGEHVLVAERSPSDRPGAIVGAVTLRISPVLHRIGPIGRMTAVVVDESARGRGIGRALVEASEKFLAERGCALVELTSNKKRTDAHAFYERLRYAATSVRFAKSLEPK